MKNLKFLKFLVGGSRSQGFRKYLTFVPFIRRVEHRQRMGSIHTEGGEGGARHGGDECAQPRQRGSESCISVVPATEGPKARAKNYSRENTRRVPPRVQVQDHHIVSSCPLTHKIILVDVSDIFYFFSVRGAGEKEEASEEVAGGVGFNSK